MKTFEANKMVECNDCEFQVQNKSDMNSHMITNHIVAQNSEEINLSHIESKSELEEHCCLKYFTKTVRNGSYQ